MRVHTCAASRQRRTSDNAMLGKGRAVRGRAVIQEGRAVKENITSGQSGDCLVYLGHLIYTWVCTWTMVCALYITNHQMASLLIVQ